MQTSGVIYFYKDQALYKSIPNFLTFGRILIIIPIIITFYFDDKAFAHKLSATLFALACITDFFDGYLARKFRWQSTFGSILDPIADKLLICSILLMIAKFREYQEIPCLLILMREIAVTGMRESLAHIRISVPVTNLAKIKTAIQMVALFTLLLGSTGSGIPSLDVVGGILLWLAAGLTVITGYIYLRFYIYYYSKHD